MNGWRILAMCAALSVLAACAGMSFAARARQAPATPATHGLTYAQQMCASCHEVRANRTVSPDPNAPSFQTIADLPGLTAGAFNSWLHSAHASMPLVVVGDADRADLFAYLQTLRRRGSST